jgi:hypothetical protein
VDDDGGAGKLTPELAERVAGVEPSEALEVVVELTGTALATKGSRQERIAAARTGFEGDLAAVTEAIGAAGGTVLEAVWLNRTVRARVPAGAIARVAAHGLVALVDLPRLLEADAEPKR